MDDQKQYWLDWAARLQRLGFAPLIAAFLEAAGPLNLLGAQAVHLARPVLRGLVPGARLDALAGLLEDDMQTQAFVASLRGGGA